MSDEIGTQEELKNEISALRDSLERIIENEKKLDSKLDLIRSSLIGIGAWVMAMGIAIAYEFYWK